MTALPAWVTDPSHFGMLATLRRAQQTTRDTVRDLAVTMPILPISQDERRARAAVKHLEAAANLTCQILRQPNLF